MIYLGISVFGPTITPGMMALGPFLPLLPLIPVVILGVLAMLMGWLHDHSTGPVRRVAGALAIACTVGFVAVGIGTIFVLPYA